jgi:hypothetical protein
MQVFWTTGCHEVKMSHRNAATKGNEMTALKPPPKIDWIDYERRVAALEAEGISRSDAQGIVDAEIRQGK